MSKYAEIFDYLRGCPALCGLWSVAATQDIGVSVVVPQGSSAAVSYDDGIDVCGNYVCEIIPYPSVYEDYQINCYAWYDDKDNNPPSLNQNVLTLDEVQSVCDWIKEQNDIGNLPSITGEKVVSVECNPFVPQIRYVDPKKNTIAYFITVRIRYVNRTQRKTVEYEA